MALKSSLKSSFVYSSFVARACGFGCGLKRFSKAIKSRWFHFECFWKDFLILFVRPI